MAYRKSEIKLLKIYFLEVQDSDASDNDVFLVGDFNRNVGDSGSLTELLTVNSMIDTVNADTPTKIKAKNNYDHILFQSQFVNVHSAGKGRPNLASGWMINVSAVGVILNHCKN